MLYDYMIYNCDIYNYLMTCVTIIHNIILYSLSKFKIK